MSQLYVVVLVVIVIALLSVAVYRTSQVKTKADYLVAGRSLPAVVLVLTLLTSWIGADLRRLLSQRIEQRLAGSNCGGIARGNDEELGLGRHVRAGQLHATQVM